MRRDADMTTVANLVTSARGRIEELDPKRFDVIELGGDLARTAGDLAQHHGLRGHDAVHLAAALAAADDDLVLVTGDSDLAATAATAALSVARPTD
jgi:predicted nucleic acid-binding protein